MGLIMQYASANKTQVIDVLKTTRKIGGGFNQPKASL
jgi:hypothetical protein